mgnify:CR=1 FL=1
MADIFEYNGVVDGQITRPQWVRVITDQSGVEHRITLTFANETERAALTVAQVYEHLANLVRYMKDVTMGISPIAQDESIPADGWHFNGNWGEVEWAKNEALEWWDSVYYLDEEDTEPSA